jgi:hypothetical protein
MRHTRRLLPLFLVFGVVVFLCGVPEAESTNFIYIRIADTTTPIPGGTGNFTSFPGLPSLSFSGDVFSNVVFGGIGNGLQGIYSASFVKVQPGPPNVFLIVADLNTPIPGSASNFTDFGLLDPFTPPNPIVNGTNTVFLGMRNGVQGIYGLTQSPVGVKYFGLADTATLVQAELARFRHSPA